MLRLNEKLKKTERYINDVLTDLSVEYNLDLTMLNIDYLVLSEAVIGLAIMDNDYYPVGVDSEIKLYECCLEKIFDYYVK